MVKNSPRAALATQMIMPAVRERSAPMMLLLQGFRVLYHGPGSGHRLRFNESVRAHHATESQVRCRRVHRLRHAGSRAIPAAVIRRTQVRTALDHAAWDLDVRHRRV